MIDDWEAAMEKEQKEGLQGLVVCTASNDYNNWHLTLNHDCPCARDE
jgi:hypothetical protein